MTLKMSIFLNTPETFYWHQSSRDEVIHKEWIITDTVTASSTPVMYDKYILTSEWAAGVTCAPDNKNSKSARAG